MSQINLTDRVLSRIVERVAEMARTNPQASKSALLNVAAAEVAGPGHDWGLLKNAKAPVLSRDLAGEGKAPAVAAPEPAAPAVVPAKVAGYRYDLSFVFVSDEDLEGLDDLSDIEYECSEGHAVGGQFQLRRTPLDKAARNKLACDLGSDESFFMDNEDEDLDDEEAEEGTPLEKDADGILPYVVEVTCLVGRKDLDPDDVDSKGRDTIAGLYGVGVHVEEGATEDDIREAVLDVFHDDIAIATLDNYDIQVRRRTTADLNVQDLDICTAEAREDLSPA